MNCLVKMSSIGLALAMMLTTIAQAQEERPRDGANRDRGQQGEGQGQGRQRGGDQAGAEDNLLCNQRNEGKVAVCKASACRLRRRSPHGHRSHHRMGWSTGPPSESRGEQPLFRSARLRGRSRWSLGPQGP